jgi:hypothetical protein
MMAAMMGGGGAGAMMPHGLMPGGGPFGHMPGMPGPDPMSMMMMMMMMGGGGVPGGMMMPPPPMMMPGMPWGGPGAMGAAPNPFLPGQALGPDSFPMDPMAAAAAAAAAAGGGGPLDLSGPAAFANYMGAAAAAAVAGNGAGSMDPGELCTMLQACERGSIVGLLTHRRDQ